MNMQNRNLGKGLNRAEDIALLAICSLALLTLLTLVGAGFASLLGAL